MTTNNFRLESGQEYTLSQLFNGKNRIVIPDLQRDYCWGDKAWDKKEEKYTELVTGFITNLIDFFTKKPNENLMLGLIYGYENPHFTIQLCDGQQRLTTLFLLLGMLNRRTENKFQNILISKEELADDKEPNLQYAIRESTLYFLSDLVSEFFLKKEVLVNDINKKDWYFKEYDLDASIQSMLKALQSIESKIENIDCNAFGEFIVNKLQLLYYDMGHRTRGEETFVVINTTGEPLSPTENLKPILIGNITDENARAKVSKEWEDREEWFWQNKREKEQISDEALKDFFIWYWQIRLLQEKTWKDKKGETHDPKELFQKMPIVIEGQEENPDIKKWEESKNLNTVHKYFNALKSLVEICNNEEISKVLKTIKDDTISLSWFRDSISDVVLPLIAYSEKFGCDDIYPFIRRIRKNHFDNKFDYRKSNYVDWRHIVQIIEFSDKKENVLVFDTLSRSSEFNKVSNVELNEWYNQDEKQKDILKLEHKAEIESWEDHDELYGDLHILWQANKDIPLNHSIISQFYQTFKLLSDCLIENNAKENPILSNYFRLYKLLIGYPTIGHIGYCSSDIEGAWFSWRDTKSKEYMKYLSDSRIISLLKVSSSKLINELESRIRSIVKEQSLLVINIENFNAARHLQAWLFVKVLYANRKNTLLAFWDGNGIATYKDYKRNVLNENLEFSLANSICGYAKKSPANRIDYASNYWGQTHCIDTTIDNFISYSEFNNRQKTEISSEKIRNIQNMIDDLVGVFFEE